MHRGSGIDYWSFRHGQCRARTVLLYDLISFDRFLTRTVKQKPVEQLKLHMLALVSVCNIILPSPFKLSSVR